MEDPSHIFAVHYPKSTQFLDISDPVHRTILQPGTTRSLLPDRNPLRKVSFSWIKMSY